MSTSSDDSRDSRNDDAHALLLARSLAGGANADEDDNAGQLETLHPLSRSAMAAAVRVYERAVAGDVDLSEFLSAEDELDGGHGPVALYKAKYMQLQQVRCCWHRRCTTT